MKSMDRKTLRAFFLATVAGAALHFLYSLWPNLATAFLSPVNESLWEHGKLLLWPGLAALLLEPEEGGRRAERCACLLLAVAGMLAAGWGYHGLLGGESVTVDMLLYVAMTAVVFLLPPRLSLRRMWRLPLFVATALLAAAFLIFTVLPPDGPLFADRGPAGVWTGRIC